MSESAAPASSASASASRRGRSPRYPQNRRPASASAADSSSSASSSAPPPASYRRVEATTGTLPPNPSPPLSSFSSQDVRSLDPTHMDDGSRRIQTLSGGSPNVLSHQQGNPRNYVGGSNSRSRDEEGDMNHNPRIRQGQGERTPRNQDVPRNPRNQSEEENPRNHGSQRNPRNHVEHENRSGRRQGGHSMPDYNSAHNKNEGGEGTSGDNQRFRKANYRRVNVSEGVAESSSNGSIVEPRQEGSSEARFERKTDDHDNDDGTSSRMSTQDGRPNHQQHPRRSRGTRSRIGEDEQKLGVGAPVRQQWRPSNLNSRRDPRYAVDQSEVSRTGSSYQAVSRADGASSDTIRDGRFPSQANSINVDPLEALEASRGAVEEALQSISISRMQRQTPEINTTMKHGQQITPDVVKLPTPQGIGRTMDTRRQRNTLKPRENHREDASIKSGAKVITKPIPNTNAPLLVQELEEKLIKGKVECMICYDSVRREAAVWSCGGCYAIFHIACIKKWARAPISADFSITSSEQVTTGNWRCPGCQAPQFLGADEINYRCFCGQIPHPQVDYYLTPHSCGGPCKKPLSSAKNPHCRHVCTMQCHPGPCPPCNALAPPQFCPCGKTSYTQRCSELKSPKCCGQICGRPLQCGRHYCEKVCHDGSCGTCNALLTVKCFCGGMKESMLCGSMDLQGELDWENGVFSCQSSCGKYLKCGKHTCKKQCHPGDCGQCELSPERLHTCPCGKVSIQKLLGPGKRRDSCTDEVPLCGNICEKSLPCGKHVCQSVCHMGDCPKCEVEVEQKCRCQSTSQRMPCHKGWAMESEKRASKGKEDDERELFLCNRTCGKKKNCGRHRCSNKCCPLANKENILEEDNPHICLLVCGKKLRCGQHTCEETCHNGHCPPCLGSTFTELTCACGKTSIPPPVPCGTFPPSCPHPCSRPQPCGHPATHQCHFGDCPPCIVLVAKECVGGHVVLRNVPCGSKDIKCNTLCGKTRQCQLHACARLCHLPPCDVVPVDAPDGQIMSCGQQCGAPRRDCQHVCVSICHPGTLCPETRCKFPVTIFCSCGRLSQQVPCDAGESSKRNDSLELAYYSSLRLQPIDGKVRIPLGQRTLACDEECAKMEKKRILADAFGVTETTIDISAESIHDASDTLRELLKKDPQWVLSVEDRFKYLVLGIKSANAGPIRVHVFKVLPREMREVIRQIAEKWNLSVSGVGREPKRFLTVYTNSKTKAPLMRDLFAKAPLPLPGQAQAPMFNPSLDMDPRLVVGLFELPRDADISSLVLRFGGECELVWLNDRNALAVFSDAARAATAIRRVDHASVYSGAVKMMPFHSVDSSSGRGSSSLKWPARKLKGGHEESSSSGWSEDAWGEELGRANQSNSGVWNRGGPAITSVNPWGALDESSNAVTNRRDKAIVGGNNSTNRRDKTSSSSSSVDAVPTIQPRILNSSADDWEELEG